MLLIEEIKRLRKRLPKIKEMRVTTPLRGGGIDPAYEFMGEMVLARNIIKKVNCCDPKATKFPLIKRCIEYKVQNEVKTIYVQEFFGRIIHASYILKNDVELHVTNDWGEHLRSCFKIIGREEKS